MDNLAPPARGLLSFVQLVLAVTLFGGSNQAMLACSCNAGHSPCGEVTAGAAAFTGKVLSVSPAFLNRLNRSSRSDAGKVTQFYDHLASGAPPQNLQGLKDAFLALIPALPPDSVQRVKEATSPRDLLKIFESVLDHGSFVTLEVGAVFTTGDRDDDDVKGDQPKDRGSKTQDDDQEKKGGNSKAKDDDDDDGGLTAGKLFSVWTPSFDCGVEFQTGETYLVYASMDEDTDTVETDTCMGTRRLSDAGADLPYLSFLKRDPKESGHLDGFVTSDSSSHANPPQTDAIPSPVAGILIELKSPDVTRYATSGKDGRVIFDGLADDTYELSGYSTEYPDPRNLVAGPQKLRIKAKTCGRSVLLFRPG